MKLLFDANLSPVLARRLQSVYPGSAHVYDIGITAPDESIFDFASKNDFIIVTKDGDFGPLSKQEEGGAKVIIVKIGNCKTVDVLVLISAHSDQITDFVEDQGKNCLTLP